MSKLADRIENEQHAGAFIPTERTPPHIAALGPQEWWLIRVDKNERDEIIRALRARGGE